MENENELITFVCFIVLAHRRAQSIFAIRFHQPDHFVLRVVNGFADFSQTDGTNYGRICKQIRREVEKSLNDSRGLFVPVNVRWKHLNEELRPGGVLRVRTEDAKQRTKEGNERRGGSAPRKEIAPNSCVVAFLPRSLLGRRQMTDDCSDSIDALDSAKKRGRLDEHQKGPRREKDGAGNRIRNRENDRKMRLLKVVGRLRENLTANRDFLRSSLIVCFIGCDSPVFTPRKTVRHRRMRWKWKALLLQKRCAPPFHTVKRRGTS